MWEIRQNVTCWAIIDLYEYFSSFMKRMHFERLPILLLAFCNAKIAPNYKINAIDLVLKCNRSGSIIVTISFPHSARPLIYMHSIRSLDYSMNVHHNFFFHCCCCCWLVHPAVFIWKAMWKHTEKWWVCIYWRWLDSGFFFAFEIPMPHKSSLNFALMQKTK